ncbi:MAG: protein translocase subunit SecD [Pirellulaceae bacterium]
MNILAQAAVEAADKIDVSPPWYQNETVLALIGIFAAIFVATFLGRFLAKTFKTPELSGRIGLLIWCLIFSAIVISIKPLKFGVDLRGGVTIIGQMNDQPGVPDSDKVTIQQLIPVLKQRIDPSGVREIVIRGLGKEQMEVIIPDVEKEEAERIWQRLTSAGQLFFRIVADETQGKHQAVFIAARETMLDRRSDVIGSPDDENPEGKKIGEWVELAREQSAPGQTGRLMPYKFMPSPNHLLRDKQTGVPINIAGLNFSGDGETARKQFSEWAIANDHRSIEILMVHPDSDRQNVEGKYLTSVQKGFDERAQPRIEFKLTGQGGRRLFSLTSRNKPQNGRHFLLGIVLDGKLQSAPRINEPIRTDGVIEGSFTEAEIEGYIAVLSSGKLDVALRKNWISMDQIRSTLGEELKTKGLTAIAISLGIVLIFMLFYYRFCGIVACIALVLNLVFVMAILMLINVNLTLTGLAGLVLTIGMSVDANVLIFERIREELKRGAALRMAIRNGFDRATTTIVDANLTTLITAVILYVIGTDQLRSFAVTLIVGILMCMFTAIYCSRIFFNIAERRRWITELKMNQIVGNNLLDFISMRKIAATISVMVIVVGLTAFFIRGKGMLDTDLAGGSTARVEFVSEMSVDQISDSLNKSDYTYMGDPIRYSVTQMKDNVRAFKIDASLPVMDAEQAPEGDPVPKLDEIISDVFKGQLVMLNMDYDPALVRLTRTDGTPINAVGGPEDGQPVGGGPNMEHLFAAEHAFAAVQDQEEETAPESNQETRSPAETSQ